MREPLNVATKIWLSLSILVLGYFISITMGIYLGHQTEYRLDKISRYIYPAANLSQMALTSFDEQIKQYEAAVLIGETAHFESAAIMAGQVDNALLRIAGLDGLDKQKADAAVGIRNRFQAFTQTASEFYPLLLIKMTESDSSGRLPQDISAQSQMISRQKDIVRSELAVFAESFSSGLKTELASIRSTSIHQRYSNLIVFILVFSRLFFHIPDRQPFHHSSAGQDIHAGKRDGAVHGRYCRSRCRGKNSVYQQSLGHHAWLYPGRTG